MEAKSSAPSLPPAAGLKDVQALLYELMTAPQGVAAGLRVRGLVDGDLSRVVRGDGRLSATERLDIYANMYFYRILDVLRDEVPRVRAVVGDAAFHDLITDYLLAHRPAHPSLREVGARLPAYLTAHPLGAAYPWLAELARLERAHMELFDGPDAAPLTLEDLRALSAADPQGLGALVVRLVPSHARLANAFTLSARWGIPSEETPAPNVVPPERQPEMLLVWRQGFEVRHRPVTDESEATALDSAAEGATIAALCEQLAVPPSPPGDPLDAQGTARAFQILASWVDDGLLTRDR